jgi:hypothetical protein
MRYSSRALWRFIISSGGTLHKHEAHCGQVLALSRVAIKIYVVVRLEVYMTSQATNRESKSLHHAGAVVGSSAPSLRKS